MEKIQVLINSIESVNAFDIVVYDMKGKSPFYDYFVISSVTSERQLNGAINHIQNDLAKHKFDHARVEGKNSNSWILVDCKDVIVNVFHKDEREYYNLEKMLAEIDQLDIEDFR